MEDDRAEILISTQACAAGRWYAPGTMRTVGDIGKIHAHASRCTS